MPFADAPDSPVSPIIAISVIVYLALCFGIGLWALKRTRSSADFFVAGKSLGLVVMAIATFSSIMSGAGFVGGPGIVYESGMIYMWVVFVATIAYPLSWAVVGKRLRLLAETREILTLPDAVEPRTGAPAGPGCPSGDGAIIRNRSVPLACGILSVLKWGS